MDTRADGVVSHGHPSLPAGDSSIAAPGAQEPVPSGNSPKGRVLSVVNQKGGVGKTTTAVNLAASLAASEHGTLLVDLDPQANATSAYGVTHPERQVYESLIGRASLLETTLPTELPHLHLVPSAPDLVGAEIELVSEAGRERRLARALEGAADVYDFVLVDCPPSLGLLTLNALTAADGVLIPLQCEYYALEGLARLLRTVDRVREGLNPALVLEGIVLTMVDLRANLSRQVIDEVREHFGSQVFETLIPRAVRLSEAPSHGKPILLYDVQSKGAVRYLQLAEELLRRCGRTGPGRKPPQLPTREAAEVGAKEERDGRSP